MTDLKKLCSTPEFHRDSKWEEEFLTQFAQSKVKVLDNKITSGPDGWPYLALSTQGDATDSVVSVIDWACSQGVGLVLNPNKELPDYLFTFGMLWNFLEKGSFFTEIALDQKGDQLQMNSGEKIFVGPPSTEYLPDYVIEVLVEFFRQQKVEEPKVLMVSQDGIDYDLCFSLESMGNPPAEEHEGILAALSWFLPNNYSLVLISEEGLPDFYLLNDLLGEEDDEDEES